MSKLFYLVVCAVCALSPVISAVCIERNVEQAQLLKEDGFVAASLQAHNVARAQHLADDLTWDSELAEAAAKWGMDCHFEHSKGVLLSRPYGENLIATSPAQQNMSSAVTAWVSEEILYDFDQPGFSEEAGHFTQVVWRTTRAVGCAQVICPTGSIFPNHYGPSIYTVCEYDPPGNIVGPEEADNFAENVMPKDEQAIA